MASSPDRPPTAAQALAHLDRSSLHELSMEALLQSLADRTKSVMPGDPEVSVTLPVDGTGATVAATGHLAVDLDRSQYERDGGPCLHAARTGVVTEIVDTRADLRWPDHVRRADRWRPWSAPYAAVTAGSVQAYRTARDRADDLQVALESRAVIGASGQRRRGVGAGGPGGRPLDHRDLAVPAPGPEPRRRPPIVGPDAGLGRTGRRARPR